MWSTKIALLIVGLCVVSCVTVYKVDPIARQELKTKYFFDYEKEEHFREVVTTGNAAAFDLFLRSYGRLPCTHGVVFVEGVDWCYSKEIFGDEKDKISKEAVARSVWLAESLANPQLSKEQRTRMLRSLSKVDVPRTFLINLMRVYSPSKVDENNKISITPASQCNEEELAIIMEIERKTRTAELFDYRECGFFGDNTVVPIVYLTVAAVCPKSASIAARVCPKQATTALKTLAWDLSEAKSSNSLMNWLEKYQNTLRLKATIDALKAGASLACKDGDLDGCRAQRDIPQSLNEKIDSIIVQRGYRHNPSQIDENKPAH